MNLHFPAALKFCWGVLLLYWIVSARGAKSPIRTESLARRLVFYWLPLAAAVYLLGPGRWLGHGVLRDHFLPHSILVESIGLSIVVVGTSVACYARYVLGANWSSVVELKSDHELIQRGPYRVIRHPIYSGLLLMFFGTAVMIGDWRGFLAVAIVFVSFWRKLLVEERWLGQHFGSKFFDYARHTKALFPGIL